MSHDGCEEVTWKGQAFSYLMHHPKFLKTENYGSAREAAAGGGHGHSGATSSGGHGSDTMQRVRGLSAYKSCSCCGMATGERCVSG
jgi:hypothetical protein